MLSRLGLQLACSGNERHQGQVHVKHVFTPPIPAELANRFEKRQTLDIANRATDLTDGNVKSGSRGQDALLDLVGNMRNDLYRTAKIIATTLAGDHRVVNLASSEAILAAHGSGDVTFIVTEVEVGFGAVIGDEHLAMLKRIHGTWVHIDVGIHLEQSDFEATALQESANRRRRQALAKGRDDSTRNENEFGFAPFLACNVHGITSSARRRSSGVSTSTVGRSVSLTVILYPHSRARNCSSFSAVSNRVGGKRMKVNKKSLRYTYRPICRYPRISCCPSPLNSCPLKKGIGLREKYSAYPSRSVTTLTTLGLCHSAHS